MQRFCLTEHPTVRHTTCALCKPLSCRAQKTRQAWKKYPQWLQPSIPPGTPLCLGFFPYRHHIHRATVRMSPHKCLWVLGSTGLFLMKGRHQVFKHSPALKPEFSGQSHSLNQRIVQSRNIFFTISNIIAKDPQHLLKSSISLLPLSLQSSSPRETNCTEGENNNLLMFWVLISLSKIFTPHSSQRQFCFALLA